MDATFAAEGHIRIALAEAYREYLGAQDGLTEAESRENGMQFPQRDFAVRVRFLVQEAFPFAFWTDAEIEQEHQYLLDTYVHRR